MLHILLLILKILLWILLGILGLIIFVLLLVLFAPIRYSADVSIHTKTKVKARISFLIVSFRIAFDQETGKLDKIIRIAGIRLSDRNKASKPVEKSDVSTDDDDLNNISKTESSECSLDTESDEIQNEEFDLWDTDKCKEDVPLEEQKLSGRIRVFFEKLFNKLKSVYKVLSEFTPDKISEKIQQKKTLLDKQINRLEKFWNYSCTLKTRAYLKKYIISLIKHVGPRKIKGHIRYGFDEPYKTGMYTGYLSLMPFLYRKGLTLEPDFYNKVIECDVSLKGRIRLGYILRIDLNINIWRTVKIAKKLLQSNKQA